ncbi:MAG: hypothetical protein KBG16_10230 [Methanospirillum sp.]|nr:hypothetical protein [Methanospirillum sp.]
MTPGEFCTDVCSKSGITPRLDSSCRHHRGFLVIIHYYSKTEGRFRSYLHSILIVMVLIPLLVILPILLPGLTEPFTVVGSDKSSVLDVMMATCPFI